MNRRGFLSLVSVSALASYGLFEHYTTDDNSGDISNAAVDSLNESLSTQKVKNFDSTFSDDVLLEPNRMSTLLSLHNKLKYLQSYVGYANFSILGVSDLIRYSNNSSKIETFTLQELELVDDLFNVNAKEYGFLGERVNYKLNERIERKILTKVAATGQYVYKGHSLDTYKRLKSDVGEELILTSGVRSIAKQLYLFVNKAVEVQGNLSKASRSLAPPGHSYHAIGDFDVGMRGLGELNFTNEFANTPVYEQIRTIEYINIRYHETNTFGVRYEPWHIKVV
ncbi:MAG: M15 family metallopeptidase [Gammaproteobacteria bacterium]|nr:M15 family metallopeptidase [Gammaproteobacteria bacterium]